MPTTDHRKTMSGADGIGMDERPRRRDGLLAQRAADSRVVLDPASGRYYALDEVSARIWDLCDGSRSVAAMVDDLAAEYDAPREEIEADVLSFLAELAGEGLVERGATGA
jgi:pyrroloquinoline quinone biosynthesis protein D